MKTVCHVRGQLILILIVRSLIGMTHVEIIDMYIREAVYCNLVTPSIRQLTCAPRAIKQAQRLQIKALTENQALRHV